MHELPHESPPGADDDDDLSPIDGVVVELLQLAGPARTQRLEALAAAEPEVALEARRRLTVLDDNGLLGAQTHEEPPAPDSIGGYRILRRLGSGGMGVVWLAEQPALQRTVALKVLHDVRLHSERARARFRREALAAARLDHPGLCAVYEVGETDGVPFLAMRYVPGPTLGELIGKARARQRAPVALATISADGGMAAKTTSTSGERRQGVLAVVEMIERVARAMHCAHQAGLVHRDLKPDNIIVEPDSTPVVLDFGLALDDSSDDAATLTLSGDRVGTPAYMAPEQVDGKAARSDARTDVYALGAVLYECLTLALPVPAVDREGLYRAIVHGAAADAARQAPGLERDLRVILATALAPERARRYASAVALAEDLARYRAHQPILAQPAGAWLRARRWTQRNPVGATLLIALAIGLAVTATLLLQVQRSLARAEASALANLAREVGESDPLAGLAIAREAYRRNPSVATLGAVYSTLAASHEERLCRHGQGVAWRCAFSGDGRFVASCSDDGTARVWDTHGEIATVILPHAKPVMDIDTDGVHVVTASMDGTVRLWAFDGAELARAPLPKREGLAGEFLRARFSHDAKKVLVTSFDGAAWIWDVEQRTANELVGHRGMVWCASFSTDDRLALTAVGYGNEIAPYADDCTARVWNLADRSSVALQGHTRPLLCAEFSADGKLALTASHDRTVRLWRTADGKLLETFEGHPAAVRCASWLPDGERFVSADLAGNVRVWRWRDGTVETTFQHEDGVWSLELSHDGTEILTGSLDKTARVHDLHGRLLRTLRGHGNKVMHATFSPDGERIATASYDQTVRLWRARDPEFPIFVGHDEGVRAISVRPDGVFVTGSKDGTVRRWSGAEATVLPAPQAGARVNQVAFSPDGRSIACVRDDQSGTVWSDGVESVHEFVGGRTNWFGIAAWRNASIAFLDNERFLVGSQDGNVWTFDASGERLPVPDAGLPAVPGSGELFDLAVHPDRGYFAAGHWHGQVLVRALDGAIVAHGQPQHSHWVTAVEFSRDGRWLVSASADRTAALWRWRDGQLERHATMVHEAALSWAGFSPDGQRILTTAIDGTAHLWNLDGDELLVIRASRRALRCGAWSHDGKRIFTGADDGIVRGWPVDPAHVLDLARQRDTRDLGPEERARIDRVTR